MHAVGTRYWNLLRNLGDGITATLIRDLLGLAPVVVGPEAPHVLGVGSVLSMATPASRLWGCGLSRPDAPLLPIRPEQVAALRGTHTVSALRARGVAVPDGVPLGDPGVLVRHLPQVRAWQAEAERRGPRYRAALVPHWSFSAHPVFTGFPGLGDDVVLADMRDDTPEPLRALIEAEVVLSQGLHGLIFAEALGKPTLWIAGRDDDAWRFKFADWYTNVADPPDAPVPPEAIGRASFALARRRTVRVDEKALLAAFPGEAARLEAPDGLIPFDRARAASPHLVAAQGLLDGAPRRVDQVPAAQLRDLSRDLDAALARLYRDWAERPVTLLARPGLTVPRDLALRLRAFLERYEVGSLAVLRRSRAGGLVAGPGQSWGDWAVYPRLGVLGDALLIRPDTPDALEGRMDTVVVPG